MAHAIREHCRDVVQTQSLSPPHLAHNTAEKARSKPALGAEGGELASCDARTLVERAQRGVAILTTAEK